MVRYNVMHAIPIFNKESLEYLREEKNGYITIILKNHPELRELIINPTAVEILKKCDGENTMEDIHNYLCDKYDSIDSKQIANDVLQVLSNFTKVGLISWKGEKNPFMSIYEEMLDGIRLRIAEETDIKSIIKMVEVIKSKKGDESILCYINPYKKIDIEYQEVAIRQKLFAFTEEFVLVSKDNNDIGLISFAIPIDYKSSAWSINLIYIPIEVFDKAFKYAIT
ncbi:Coenzyme PQQ synthesis protein D (PqqD) [Thermoanaerobacter thermohydrosulfuricus]|nr:Coenzyme PQQ synthesis protein D (PqqD) [Thermoanaerobacter thermohydrosulfuricus]